MSITLTGAPSPERAPGLSRQVLVETTIEVEMDLEKGAKLNSLSLYYTQYWIIVRKQSYDGEETKVPKASIIIF